MIPVNLENIAEVTGGKVIQGHFKTVFNAVSTDSRTLKRGQLFIALRGETYDGHNFLEKAVGAGAGGLVVSHLADLPQHIPVVLVNDTLQALQSLAAYNRIRISAFLVGVTGSTGKTTTKDILASVLATRLVTHKTSGNYNNEVGLPHTLLQMGHDCQAAVVEMAMRGAGEIDSLCRIAKPDCAVITTINETHMELLGDLSSIAAAKGEILAHIPPEGFALLPAESPFIKREAARCKGRVIFFGTSGDADIRAENIRPTSRGSSFDVVIGGRRDRYTLPIPGRHNVVNALAAIGVGREMGLTTAEIARGLEAVDLTGMRLEITSAGGIKIINDSYNASPASTRAALQTLVDIAAGGRKIAMLGDMLELGQRALSGHWEVGAAATGLQIDYLITVGELAQNIQRGAHRAGMDQERALHCQDNQEAVKILENLLQPGDTVLVKGSRGMKMESIVQSLVKSQAGMQE